VKKMTWEMTFAECDSAVREWMVTQGWPVTGRTHPDFRYNIYAWRHEGADNCYTLWITRIVMEDTEPLTLVRELDRLKVAEKLRERPDDYTRVKTSGKGLVVEQLPPE
jgi:hypothetical protein